MRWPRPSLVSQTSQPSRGNRSGLQADGGFLLNSGWRVKPAGTQVPVDTLPMSSAAVARWEDTCWC